MIHARVDVVILGHERAFAAGIEAMGLWLFMLAHTREQERDGFVPAAIAHAAWGGRANAKLADRLVKAGLVERVDGGYRIVNYAAKNETKVQIDARRKAEADRKAEYRGRGTKRGVPPGQAQMSQRDTRGTDTGVPQPESEPESESEPDLPLGGPPLGSAPPDENRVRAVAADGLFDGSPEVYRRAMAAALGSPQGPLTTWERKDLAGLIATHAGRITGPALETWLAEAATGFAASGKAPFGARPKHLAGWLDAGRPAAAKAARQARPSTLQGHGKDDWGQYAAPPIGDETP